MKIMGLDISSSCIGLSLIDYSPESIKLLAWDYYKPKKDKGIFSSLAGAKEYIRGKILEWEPEEVVIEEIANHFAGGKSSARTIITLAVYNRIIGLEVFETTGKEPKMMNVNTVRSKLKEKRGERIKKEDIPVRVSSILSIDFPYVYNRKGNIDKVSYDIGDSIALCLGYCFSIK